MNANNTEVFGAVRIGRTGTKMHSAKMHTAADGRQLLVILCGCAGTQNGAAYSKAKFFEGARATCQN
jgi:hypothetical protein